MLPFTGAGIDNRLDDNQRDLSAWGRRMVHLI